MSALVVLEFFMNEGVQVSLTIRTSCISSQTVERVAESAGSASPRPPMQGGMSALPTWAPPSPVKLVESGSRMRGPTNCIGSPVMIGLQLSLEIVAFNINTLPPFPVCANFKRLFIGKVGSVMTMRSQCCICLRDLKNEPSLKEHMRLCHGVK